MSKQLLSVFIMLSLLGVSSSTIADFDVDDADTLNFEAFHRDKNPDKEVWKQQESKKEVQKTGIASTETSLNSDKEFEIRERYSLSRSTQTPYSAFFVIEALHKQMAQLCPQGWKKLAERSEPIEQDFYLYYELKCL
ncbi:hypothetical protein [Oceanicoccus sp. KOV_DT_Chl]|uniref:hypothetical protein n=1 Tax=Oceanicoccus sp. KOV_DT_Chl TaxID=1904639 RepID=UPI000C7D41BA|nr:hypothetical protein [Oceanicoccus sp. KOV_DT_Chl]